MRVVLIFNLLIICQFIDFNIGSLALKAIVISLIFIYFLVSSKIIFRAPILFLIMFLIYAVFSSLNLYGEMESLNATRGYMRPILIFVVVFVQIYLALYLFRSRAGELMPKLLVVFLAFEILLLLSGLVDNAYLKNEKGLHANLVVFLIYLFLRERVSLKFFFIPIVSLVSTVSSSMLALVPIIFRKHTVSLIILLLLTPFVFFVFDEIVVSKISLLLSPPDIGTYGGRYWSNLIYIAQIKENPFFGSGIESLYLYKKEHFLIETFDHGGSDILRLIAEFGVVGTALLYVSYMKIHNRIVSYGYNVDFIGLAIVLMLSVKGIQIFSNPGMLLMVFFVVYKRNKNYFEKKRYRVSRC